MAARKKTETVNDAWYTLPGEDQDVVVSTRSMLLRNLANFPFPEKLSEDECCRIQSIAFDAFNHLDDAEKYQTVSLSKLDENGIKVMRERGILGNFDVNKAGLILRDDGKIACSVNTQDHLSISAFCSGFALEQTVNPLYSVDNELQNHIQFAASHDFGYLTSNIITSGSGLGLAVKVHLPALSMLYKLRYIAENVAGTDFSVIAAYGAGGADSVSGFGGTGSSLGCYYLISTANSVSGTEFDQMTSMQCTVNKIIKEERDARKECRAEHMTEIKNFACRALGLAKNSLFVSLRESIEIISGVKFAKEMNLIGGIDDSDLHALLYRVQEGHLEFVLGNGKFKFEKDIQDNRQKKIERLRALILQEAFDSVEL